MLSNGKTTFIAISARTCGLIRQDHSFGFEVLLKSSVVFLFRKVNHDSNLNTRLASSK